MNCTAADLQTDLNCYYRPDGMSVICSQFTKDLAYSKLIVYHLAKENIDMVKVAKREDYTVIIREDTSLKELR